MSLRVRVAIATIAATLVVVALAGSALVALVAASERDQLDETLEARARVAAGRAAALAPVLRDAPAADLPVERPSTAGVVARVLVDGVPYLVLGDNPLEDEAPAPEGLSTIRVGGERYRVLTEDMEQLIPTLRASQRWTDAGVTVEVSSPMTEVTQTNKAVVRQVVRVGLAAVVLAAALGWVFGGAALRPLARLRRDAERVSGTDDLDVRVADDQGMREVDDLGRSLNHMLDRIRQATLETQVALDSSRAFAGNAAHELRTPLTSMQANLDVLERNPGLGDDERAAILEDIQDQQRRLLGLLGALRLLARGDLEHAPLDQAVDLADVVDASVAHARTRHPSAEFTTAFVGGPFTLAAWEEGLQVMVDNLLDNAALHGTPSAGAGALVMVTVSADAEGLHVVVDDHGPGIPPDERQLVMQRFGRGRASTGPGSGLGLALVDQQATLHGGRVEIGDSPDGGARLVVTLPAPRDATR